MLGHQQEFYVSSVVTNYKYKEKTMLNKFSLLAFGAMLGFGVMALSGGGASAAAMLPLSPLAASQSNVTSDGIIQVAQGNQDRRMRSDWNRNRDGNRCSRRSGDCRHFHRGYYYDTPWWTLPLIIGGTIAANNYDDEGDWSSGHVGWCSDRYRSYNPRTNTWVAYSGRVYECNSPY
jgi:hypothetical protein